MPASNLQQALTLLQQNAVDDAVAVLKETVDDVPAHTAAYVLLARAYEAKQEWEEALHAWEQARFLVPTSPTVREGKQRVLRHLGPTAPEPEASAKPTSGTTPIASPSKPDEEESSSPGHSPSSAADALEELERLRREEATDAEREEERQESAASSTPDASSEGGGDRSELEQLRRMAEAEARRGGARGGMAAGISSDDEDSTELEQLRRQADAEARRGGARGGMTSEPSASGDTKKTARSSSEDALSSSGFDLNEDFDDLDRLIEELESARITPTPNPTDASEPESIDLEENEDDRADDLVSETLARIYASQGKYREAMRAYLKLAAQKPDQTRTFLEKASTMRVKAEHAETSAND